MALKEAVDLSLDIRNGKKLEVKWEDGKPDQLFLNQLVFTGQLLWCYGGWIY
jgi:hypothetical protein